jgi:ketopantoate reductase
MKILIVGSGAVGQVLGQHLQSAGFKLAFFARPESAARLQQALDSGGMPVFQITHRQKRKPIARRLETFQLVKDFGQAREFEPDQIWFTTPSPVYYSSWFRDFLRAVPSGRVVCFAPEGARPAFFLEGVPEDRLVFGGITFIAWQGDLEGGGGQPEGVTFWRPPLLEIPLVGDKEAGQEVAAVLQNAGFRAAVKDPDYSQIVASTTAVQLALATGLELCGWSFGALRGSRWLRRVAAGSREAVLSQNPGAGPFARLLIGLLLSPAGLLLATLLLPLLFPFDLASYLKFHYLKTRDQTVTLLALFIDDGTRRGLPVENIRLLLQALNDSEAGAEPI